MIPSYLQRNNNNSINYILVLYKKYNKKVIFFNFSLIGEVSFIFYISRFSPPNRLKYSELGCKRWGVFHLYMG